MFEQYTQEIQELAKAAYPNEVVVLITEQGLKPVENIHPDPEHHFEVSKADTVEAYQEGLLAVVHSHTHAELAPSKHDMEVQEIMGVPWGLLKVGEDYASEIIWWDGKAQGTPYEGRGFIHGVSDCYSLVRDFYLNHSVELPIVPREWEWWESEELFDKLFKPFGFEEVPVHQAAYGDMLVIKIRGEFSHHCGIMVEDEQFLHHPGAYTPYDMSRLSVKDTVHRYLPYVVKVLRHKDFKYD